jgi:hypothetical protein
MMQFNLQGTLQRFPKTPHSLLSFIAAAAAVVFSRLKVAVYSLSLYSSQKELG